MVTRTRSIIAAALAGGALLVASPESRAADYPCDRVEWIVGWGAGGGSDMFARSIAPAAADALGAPITVINMPGASSIVAMEEVTGRDADGCTLFSITPDQLTNEITGLTELSYKDLTPIMRAHVDVGMLYSGAGSDLASWDNVLQTAQDKEILIGGTGAASFDEIVVQALLDSADVKYRYIPYESASDMHADLIGGRLDLVYDEVSVMDPMIKAGQVRPVLALADERLDAYSEIPAAAELGYVVPPSLWRGVAVKSGTAEETVKALESAFMKSAESEAYQQFERDRLLNLYPGRLGSSDFASSLEKEYKTYEQVSAGLAN